MCALKKWTGLFSDGCIARRITVYVEGIAEEEEEEVRMATALGFAGLHNGDLTQVD